MIYKMLIALFWFCSIGLYSQPIYPSKFVFRVSYLKDTISFLSNLEEKKKNVYILKSNLKMDSFIIQLHLSNFYKGTTVKGNYVIINTGTDHNQFCVEKIKITKNKNEIMDIYFKSSNTNLNHFLDINFKKGSYYLNVDSISNEKYRDADKEIIRIIKDSGNESYNFKNQLYAKFLFFDCYQCKMENSIKNEKFFILTPKNWKKLKKKGNF